MRMKTVSKIAIEGILGACRLLSSFQSNLEHQRFLEKCIAGLLKEMGVGGTSAVNDSGEAYALKFLLKRHNPVVFDVGANVGEFARVILQIQPDSELHCFEPSPFSFEALKQALPENPNLFLNPLALGNERGQGSLFSQAPGSTLSSLYNRRLDHFNIVFSEEKTVKIETLDQYCKEKSVSKIDLLKINVEGHELSVLQGGSQLFRNRSIARVMFEFGGTQIDSRTFFQDFFYFFEGVQMRLHRVTPSGYLYPLKSYREVYEQFLLRILWRRRLTNFRQLAIAADCFSMRLRSLGSRYRLRSRIDFGVTSTSSSS